MAYLTLSIISWLKDALGIETPFRRSSEFELVGATEYIWPPGSREDLNESVDFVQRGLRLRYFNYKHLEYPQRFGDFLPYMSVVNLLFNCGPEGLSLIEKGSELA